MKVEPIIDKTALVETIRREYGPSIRSLTFLPVGWAAYCYVAECADDERYFLKLSGDSGVVSTAASDLDFWLPLTYQLDARGMLPDIAHPIRTQDGHLKTCFEDYFLILFNFIEGKTVGFGRLPDDTLTELARWWAFSTEALWRSRWITPSSKGSTSPSRMP